MQYALQKLDKSFIGDRELFYLIIGVYMWHKYHTTLCMNGYIQKLMKCQFNLPWHYDTGRIIFNY